mgnify:CR=1 FL=1
MEELKRHFEAYQQGMQQVMGSLTQGGMADQAQAAWDAPRQAKKSVERPAAEPPIGPAAAALLTGSIIVETIFSVPGVGRYFVDGALNRDYTLVMATVSRRWRSSRRL